MHSFSPHDNNIVVYYTIKTIKSFRPILKITLQSQWHHQDLVLFLQEVGFSYSILCNYSSVIIDQNCSARALGTIKNSGWSAKYFLAFSEPGHLHTAIVSHQAPAFGSESRSSTEQFTVREILPYMIFNHGFFERRSHLVLRNLNLWFLTNVGIFVPVPLI